MFIVTVTYKKPLEEVDRFLAAHREFLTRHYATGDIVTSGPQTPRKGGIIVIKVDSREKAEVIIHEDPFFINKIADYTVVEFTPTKFCDDRLKTIFGIED